MTSRRGLFLKGSLSVLYRMDFELKHADPDNEVLLSAACLTVYSCVFLT